ncbi:hypothetical protein [Agrobacterium larrymoorei]|nr:hypothetical protein [Agrobacterium larrymoorei]
MQLLTILLLVIGSFTAWQPLIAASVVLAVLSILMQWGKLLKLGRVFFCVAVCAAAAILWFQPQMWVFLWKAVIQGVAFAALMMVLGMLRFPVRRSPTVRQASAYLIVRPPNIRYAVINIGAQFLSLLFNVGMIAMIGDLTRPADGRADPARRAMVIAAMRGAALVSIWSPVGLGFSIVTTGIPGLDAAGFLLLSATFTMAALLATALFPNLPTDARVGTQAGMSAEKGSLCSLMLTLAACAILLALAIGLHQFTGISFTLASVTVLPVFSILWLVMEPVANNDGFLSDLSQSVSGLSDLTNESAIFLSANVIGAALSIFVGGLPIWQDMLTGALPALPLLLGCLIVIPLAAALFIPNSVFVVMLAQLLGPSPLGQAHPLSLALTLSVGWAAAISLSPISAMCLITGSFCGVSSRKVAWVWNRRFVCILLTMAATTITMLQLWGL